MLDIVLLFNWERRRRHASYRRCARKQSPGERSPQLNNNTISHVGRRDVRGSGFYARAREQRFWSPVNGIDRPSGSVSQSQTW